MWTHCRGFLGVHRCVGTVRGGRHSRSNPPPAPPQWGGEREGSLWGDWSLLDWSDPRLPAGRTAAPEPDHHLLPGNTEHCSWRTAGPRPRPPWGQNEDELDQKETEDVWVWSLIFISWFIKSFINHQEVRCNCNCKLFSWKQILNIYHKQNHWVISSYKTLILSH